jgi:hypothetical protein
MLWTVARAPTVRASTLGRRRLHRLSGCPAAYSIAMTRPLSGNLDSGVSKPAVGAR